MMVRQAMGPLFHFVVRGQLVPVQEVNVVLHAIMEAIKQLPHVAAAGRQGLRIPVIVALPLNNSKDANLYGSICPCSLLLLDRNALHE